MFMTRKRAKKLNCVELFDAWDKIAPQIELTASEYERNCHYEKADELINALEIVRKAVERNFDDCLNGQAEVKNLEKIRKEGL